MFHRLQCVYEWVSYYTNTIIYPVVLKKYAFHSVFKKRAQHE